MRFADLYIACVVLPLVALGTILAAPVQILLVAMDSPASRKIPLLWHRAVLRLIGVRVHVRGVVPRQRPLMIVANHISWSDIMVLGSIMELCFVAKSEIRAWPGISFLARMQRSVFVERARRHETGNQADTIAARLLEGDAIVLFAEGTTGDGHRILPFKTALFGAIHYALKTSPVSHVRVQPVAVAYTRLNGLPLGRQHQSRAAWPGDVPLGPHLMAFLRHGAYDVDVVFGAPTDFDETTSRKEIAERMFRIVREDFASAMRMRGA